jgi:Methylamine utilisation protein MauE
VLGLSSYLDESVAALFTVIFGAAALGKARDFHAWTDVTNTLTRGRRVLLVAVSVPVVEASAAASPAVLYSGALWIFAPLMLTFSTLSCGLSRRHRGLRCGCFGPASHSNLGPRLCARNTVLALLAPVALLLGPAATTNADERLAFVVATVGYGALWAIWRAVSGRRNHRHRSFAHAAAARAGIYVFVSPTCPSCHALLEALDIFPAGPASAPIALVPVHRSPPTDEWFPSDLWPFAREDLAHLARAWHVDTVPYLVVVGADGAITLREELTDPARVAARQHIATAATHSVPPQRGRDLGPASESSGPRLSRREVLISALVGSISLAKTASALGSSIRQGSPMRTLGGSISLTEWPENTVNGSCSKWKRHMQTKGPVDFLGLKNGQHQTLHSTEAFGFTFPNDVESVLLDYQIGNAGYEYSWYYCPCPDKQEKKYSDVNECATDCQSGGLDCFAQQCQYGPRQFCASIFFTLAARVNEYRVSIVRWNPSNFHCERDAELYFNFIKEHEMHHVRDGLDIEKHLRRNFKFRRCSPSKKQTIDLLMQDMREHIAKNPMDFAFREAFGRERPWHANDTESLNDLIRCGVGC